MNRSREPKLLPLPKGNSPYALAKRAQYVDRNIPLAKQFYFRAIQTGQRKQSALKDLASLYHQQGNTQEALSLLLRHEAIFEDQQKFQNLLKSLQDKRVPTGNSLNKQIKISPLTENDSIACIRRLFRDSSRIQNIEIVCSQFEKYALLTFASHSAARKTLSGFHKWNRYKVDWVSPEGDLVGSASFFRNRPRPKQSEMSTRLKESNDLETGIQLLGADLFYTVSDVGLKSDAEPFVPKYQ